MKKKSKLIAAGLGLAQLALIGAVQAQDVKSLNEVVVSATKNNQKQWQSGKVVTIIDSVQLSRSSGKTVAELLNQQAGLQVLGAGSTYGKDKSVFIRGAASAYTVVIIDGIPVSDPSSIGTPFDLKLIAIDQVERIEILRGGQSTIYGSDAVAGVINIITKKQGNNTHLVNGTLSAGSYDTYKGNIGLSGKVDDFTFNVGYTHFKSNGISEATVPVGNTSTFDKDGTKQDGFNANFSLQLTKNLAVSPFLRYSHVQFDYDDNAFIDAKNKSNTKSFNGGANVVYSLDKSKFTLNYSLQNTERDYKSIFPATYKGTNNILDLYYNQNIGDKINLLLGIDNRNTNVTYYTPTGTNTPSIHIISGYGSLFLHDLSLFNLEIGGRYNKHNKYGENNTYTITPSILLGNNVKLFGTASSSFRAPALDMLFGAWGANLNLKPEKAKQLEAGIDFNFFAKKLNVKTAIFSQDITDAIIYGANGYINQDKQKLEGFEIEPNVQVGKFNLGGHYTYVKGKTISGSVVKNDLQRRPKYSYGINLGFELNNQFNVSANYKFNGKRTDIYYNPVTWMQENKNLASYGLLDIYAEYAFLNNRLKLFVDLKNITNEKYIEIYGYQTMGFNSNAGLSFNF